MTKRQQFVEYVKNGGKKFCSPQIGCGAGFDTKMIGKEWISETTMADTVAVTDMFDMVPLFNIGLPDAGFCDPSLNFQLIDSKADDHRRTSKFKFETPKGTLYREFMEDIKMGVTPTKFPVEEEDDLAVLEWFLDRSLETDLSPLVKYVSDLNETIGDKGALSLQWGAQPYELLSWPSTVNTMFLANDCPEIFKRLMDKVLELDIKLIDCCKKGGADFIFLGGPAAEIISPAYYEEFIVPYSKLVTAEAHKQGLLVYTHICSPIEPMLTKGYYNEMGIDLFETLSMKPVGNVQSLADALDKLDPAICTRGNIGLDLMVNEPPEKIQEACFQALKDSEGRKHILAASDYLFYNTPEENVRAMCESVKLYQGDK